MFHGFLQRTERAIKPVPVYIYSTLEQRITKSLRLMQELKPKVLPATLDKKTAFWNAYKTLADEYDKELLQRYSTDLETSLIFACSCFLDHLASTNCLSQGWSLLRC
jgi:Cft2 family RNA processing exonuclease